MATEVKTLEQKAIALLDSLRKDNEQYLEELMEIVESDARELFNILESLPKVDSKATEGDMVKAIDRVTYLKFYHFLSYMSVMNFKYAGGETSYAKQYVKDIERNTAIIKQLS